MMITDSIIAQFTDADSLLESVYKAIAEVDPAYVEEMSAFEKAVAELNACVPGAAEYLNARRTKLASDIRFAIWQGFIWNYACHLYPVNKLRANMDFEELCQEAKMNMLPDAQSAQVATCEFVQTLSQELLTQLYTIGDHFAYLETYGYKIAFSSGYELANRLLPLVVPGYIVETFWDSFMDV